MTPVSLDLSKYVVQPLPGTGPVTYLTEGTVSYPQATLQLSGSVATITPLQTPGLIQFQFKVKQDAYEAAGTINVRVYDYHGFPGLVNPYQFPTCYDYMGPVTFTSRVRFMTNYVPMDQTDATAAGDIWPGAYHMNSSDFKNDRLYGFQTPMVADFNNDGYPEIVALGRINDTDGIGGSIAYVDIYDGRTGVIKRRYRADGATGSTIGYTSVTDSHPSPGLFAIVDSDRNGKLEIIVAWQEAGSNFPDRGKLVSYEISNDGNFNFTKKWGSNAPTWYPGGYARCPVVQVVDFDGNGTVEVLVHNKIYNAVTGALLVTLETLDHSAYNNITSGSFIGRNPYNLNGHDDAIAFSYIYDIDLDGRYDVIAGDKVYYDIRPTTGGYRTLKRSTGTVYDGRAGVADMDCDGIPDIVVARRTSSTKVELYVWNPGFLTIQNGSVVKNYTPDGEGRNATAPGSFTPSQIGSTKSITIAAGSFGSNSYIYIGDIDGKVQTVNGKEYRLPEVAILSGDITYDTNVNTYHPNIISGCRIPAGNNQTSAGDGVIAAYTMDMANNRNLKLSFIMEHNDRSGNTGFAMFDFDNDGIQELCYRDEENLRIIKANKEFVTLSESLGSTVIFSVKCGTYTGFEMPVIADVDGDNSAEVVVVGKNQKINNYYGFLYVVGSGSGEKFAPAWPIWNQLMYDPFKINPDGTTPTGLAPNRLDKKYNFVREIKNASGQITKTLTDYQPFNGTLVQATRLDAQSIPKFEPVVFLTEAYIISDISSSKKPKIVSSGNNHYIELTIGNKASSRTSILSNTPVKVYRNNTISQATVYRTLTLQDLLNPGTANALGATASISPGTEKTVWISIGSGAIPGAGDAIVGDVYIVRLGDASSGNPWIWRFGYNGGDKFGDAYPCDDFDEGLGKAASPFRDCNWCDQAVRAARYQTIRDLLTIEELTSVSIDVMKNDILPIVPLAGVTPTKSFMDTVRLNTWNISKPPVAGYLSFNNAVGSGARITYHHDNRASLPANIDSFQYRLTYYNDVTAALETKTSTVYIYILKGAGGGFSSCYGQSTRIEMQNKPAGISFEWYRTQYDNVKIQANSTFRVTQPMQGDSTYWLKPLTSGITTTTGLTAAQIAHYKTLNFPRGEILIRLVTYPAKPTSLMRWTGHVSNQWRDPRNWVEVRSVNGREAESPVTYSPAPCSNVIIPSNVNNYPELADSENCKDITLKDRAMLGNPHALQYAAASVEIKLKPSERDRFVMWSAPLMSMYSGDYHYRNGAGDIKWGDVFMNMFQTANPDGGGTAEVNRFTATFADVTRALPLGTAFNLKVTSTSTTRDSLFRFPRIELEYTPAGGSPTSLAGRNNSNKFVTHGKTLDALGQFKLNVYGDMAVDGTQRLVQVVNPYMAYLSVDSFLKYNTNLKSGYYLWDGEVGTDMNAVAFTSGNRISVTTPPFALQTQSPSLAYIPPLQSFFVAKNTPSASLGTVNMSPYWTTTSPVSSYILRAATMVKSGGVMNITLTGGTRRAHAALIHTIGSGASSLDREDMPAVIHTVDNQTSLSLYTLSAGNERLAINSNEHFAMLPVQLGMTVTNGGEYRLEFSNLETFGYDVILVDKQQGNKQIDLRKTPEYRFSIANQPGGAAIEISNRFELRFNFTGHGVNITSVEPIAVSPNLRVSSGRGYIQVTSTNGPIESLQVYDAAGRRTFHNPAVNEARIRIPVSGRGMYVVKAIVGKKLQIAKTIAIQ
jgi:hypothetical protein